MIEKQETIILTVVPANVDIATNEALQLAKTFDGDGERTLGMSGRLTWRKRLSM